VQNGVFDCPLEVKIIPFVCDIFKSNPYHFLDSLGLHLSFEDYFKDPSNEQAYLANNDFLPYVRTVPVMACRAGGCCRGSRYSRGCDVRRSCR
jgi:hypothetical protein